jgi:ABC-type multidrug transport system fused ATPase/permease subunit
VRKKPSAKADGFCLFAAGQIAEQGSHPELMRLSGRYARMVNQQQNTLETV